MPRVDDRIAAGLAARGPDLLVALGAGIAGLAGSYAVAGFTPAFIAGPIAGVMARRMPAAVVSFAIVVLGDLGHQLNLVGALGLATVGLGATALAGMLAAERLERGVAAPAAAAVAGALLALAVTAAPLASAAAGAAAGAVVGVWSFLPAGSGTDDRTGRRRLVGAVGAALVLGIAGTVAGSRGAPHGATMSADVVGETGSVEMPVRDFLAEAEAKGLDVEGLEPLVSTDFYEVDINATDPTVDADRWRLRVTGAVDEEIEYTYDEIRAMPAENRFVTLRCVGEALNGKKMDNAVWTGVRVPDLLEPAGVRPGCCVMFRAADGFFEEFPIGALENGMLAYGMNGRVLPRGHGYPVRALIPGHWGEINVKWITEIEVLESEADGYWELRGWHGTGPVNTVAKLHVVNRLDDGRIEVAGHAYAGTRGIETVEVSTDGGGSWETATVSAPLTGDAVWQQWVHRYEPPGGAHEVVVRATDGTGALQPRTRADSFPSGATGWVSMEVAP